MATAVRIWSPIIPLWRPLRCRLAQAGGTFSLADSLSRHRTPSIRQTELDDDGGKEDFYTRPSVGDLNGDGQLDIAVPDPSGAIQLLLSTCGQPTGDLSVAVQPSADPVA